MWGPMISDRDIAKLPAWARFLFNIFAVFYFTIAALVVVLFIPVAAVRNLISIIRNK